MTEQEIWARVEVVRAMPVGTIEERLAFFEALAKIQEDVLRHIARADSDRDQNKLLAHIALAPM